MCRMVPVSYTHLDVYKRQNGGIVAYSNEVKMSLLHVSAETLEKYGAVSRETVIEMVKGAMKALKTDCAVATSGIAGPGAVSYTHLVCWSSLGVSINPKRISVAGCSVVSGGC